MRGANLLVTVSIAVDLIQERVGGRVMVTQTLKGPSLAASKRMGGDSKHRVVNLQRHSPGEQGPLELPCRHGTPADARRHLHRELGVARRGTFQSIKKRSAVILCFLMSSLCMYMHNYAHDNDEILFRFIKTNCQLTNPN